MDALLPVLCLLLGVALPVALGAVLVLRGMRQTAAPVAYRQVARRLGLDVDTRGASVSGYLARSSRKLYIGEVMVGHGPDRRFQHRAILALERPLGLGIAVRKRMGRNWFRRETGHELQSGDEAFDRKYKINGDDDERVRQLLSDDIRQRIAALGERQANLLVSDHHVRALLHRPATNPDELFGLITEMGALADALLAARSRVSAPSRLQALHGLFADLASERGLTLDPQWPALHGQLGEHRIELAIRREADGYRAAITGWLREPLDLGFRLRRQVRPDGYWSVGQDIQVNDEAFDAAFVIKGYDPDTVRERLSGSCRRHLLGLSELGELVVDDHTLRISRLALDAGTLRDALDRAAACLRSIEPDAASPTEH